MTTEPTMTAGDLTPDHYGLTVSYTPLFGPGAMTAPFRKTIVLDELRQWHYKGELHVGMSDFTPSGSFMGTEYSVTGSTPVTVGARVRKARKRPWSKAAMAPITEGGTK